jgi:hypothetical protein
MVEKFEKKFLGTWWDKQKVSVHLSKFCFSLSFLKVSQKKLKIRKFLQPFNALAFKPFVPSRYYCSVYFELNYNSSGTYVLVCTVMVRYLDIKYKVLKTVNRNETLRFPYRQ